MFAPNSRWLPAPDPSGPVTCAVCGCRLTEAGSDRSAWRHFSSLHPGQDARGCRTACSDALHGRDGRVLGAARGPIAFAVDAALDDARPQHEDAAAA
jgi:hypothetical protein